MSSDPFLRKLLKISNHQWTVYTNKMIIFRPLLHISATPLPLHTSPNRAG